MSIELILLSIPYLSRSYGAVIELNRGAVTYTTPGGKDNLVIVVQAISFRYPAL